MKEDVFFSLAAVPTPLLVAARKHWIEQCFAQYGVTAQNLNQYPMGEMLHFYQSSARHFRVGGSFSAIWAKANGADTIVINFSWIPTRTEVLVARTSTFSTIKDLQGCRLTLPVRDYLPVDYPRLSAFHAWVTLLESQGMAASDVEFLLVPTRRVQQAQQEGLPTFMPQNHPHRPRPQKEEGDVVLAGKADAMLTLLGRGVRYLEHGDLRSLYRNAPGSASREPLSVLNAYPVATVVHRVFAEQHPDLVRLWLRLERMAAAWAGDNPRDYAETLAGMTDIPVSLQNQAFSLPDAAYAGPDPERNGFAALEGMKDFMLKHNIISQDFSIQSWLVLNYLNDVCAEIV